MSRGEIGRHKDLKSLLLGASSSLAEGTTKMGNLLIVSDKNKNLKKSN